jgi:hypothetical protein
MKSTTNLIIMLLMAPTVLQARVAVAEETLLVFPSYIAQSIIDSNVLSHVRGRFSVNMTAGDSNVQANAAAVALGAKGGPTLGFIGGIQVTNPRQGDLPDYAIAIIGKNAFANSSGLISVNQSSGVGNAQANGAVFALGFDEVLADSVLSSTTSGVVPIGSVAGKGNQAVSINDAAFYGSHGLVQVNQSAGSGNSTTNNFVLQVQLGTKP